MVTASLSSASRPAQEHNTETMPLVYASTIVKIHTTPIMSPGTALNGVTTNITHMTPTIPVSNHAPLISTDTRTGAIPSALTKPGPFTTITTIPHGSASTSAQPILTTTLTTTQFPAFSGAQQVPTLTHQEEYACLPSTAQTQPLPIPYQVDACCNVRRIRCTS